MEAIEEIEDNIKDTINTLEQINSMINCSQNKQELDNLEEMKQNLNQILENYNKSKTLLIQQRENKLNINEYEDNDESAENSIDNNNNNNNDNESNDNYIEDEYIVLINNEIVRRMKKLFNNIVNTKINTNKECNYNKPFDFEYITPFNYDEINMDEYHIHQKDNNILVNTKDNISQSIEVIDLLEEECKINLINNTVELRSIIENQVNQVNHGSIDNPNFNNNTNNNQFVQHINSNNNLTDGNNYELFIGKLISEPLWFYFKVIEMIDYNHKLFLNIVKVNESVSNNGNNQLNTNNIQNINNTNNINDINNLNITNNEIKLIEFHLFEGIYLTTEIEKEYLYSNNSINHYYKNRNSYEVEDEDELDNEEKNSILDDYKYTNKNQNKINNQLFHNDIQHINEHEFGGWMKNSSKKFGLKYLEKYGFLQGDGLGKNKDGISEPIILNKHKTAKKVHAPFHLKNEFNEKLTQSIKSSQETRHKYRKYNFNFEHHVNKNKKSEKDKDVERLNNILNSSYIKRDYYSKMKKYTIKDLLQERDKITKFLSKHKGKDLKKKNEIKYNIKIEIISNLISLKSNSVNNL